MWLTPSVGPLAILALLMWTGTPAAAQSPRAAPRTLPSAVRPVPAPPGTVSPSAVRPSPKPAPVSVRQAARRDPGRRVIISLRDRTLWWMHGRDTVYTAPIAVGKGTRLSYGGKSWNFSTPRGIRKVIAKDTDPVWVPPEWHYVELAQDSALTLVRLERGRGARVADGSRLVVRGERIVHVRSDGSSEVIPADEEVVFGDTLFMPPIGTANRRIEGELGAYKLDLGNGYLIHGTPHKTSIGTAASHGCIRVGDEDLEYLYRNVPIGTRVYIY